MRRFLMTTSLLGFFIAASTAADPKPELKPIMTERGKSILNDDLSSIAKDWKAGKGKWEVVDGALRGAELKADMHGAVTRRDAAFENGVVQFAFKLDGAKSISLSMNGPKAHICRVSIRPNGFSVQKDDQDGKTGPDTGLVLSTVETPIKAGEWHTMVVEMQGKEMLATLDGEFTAYGENDAINKPKANIGLTVAGETASYKNLSVSEASPRADWDKVKEKYKKK